MKLRARLALSHGINIVLLCLVFVLALYAISRLAAQAQAIASGNLGAIGATMRIRTQIDLESTQVMRQMLAPLQANFAARQRTPTPLDAVIDAARPWFTRDEEHHALTQLVQRYRHFQNALAIWQAGQMTPPDVNELPADFAEVRAAADHLLQMKYAELNAAAQTAQDFARRMIALVTILAVLIVLAGMLATLRLVRSITRPVDQLGALVQRMGGHAGEYADAAIVYHPDSIDEFNLLGRQFETMAESLALVHATNLERIVVEQRRGEAVLDSISDGLVIFSDEGWIERINPVAERQLGIERGMAGGKRFDDIGNADVGRRVNELLATGEFAAASELEMTVVRAGETRILAYWLNRFVESQSGRPGVVMVLRDVTTQREFDKLRDEFIMHAAHELRTPIASIRMGLGLLAENLRFAPGSREHELFDTVQRELERMIGLLTDLLDLSRLRSGEQGMQREPTEIPELLAQARRRFDPAAIHAGIALEAEVETGLPRLELCRSAFDRVLDNLVGNALRHTPEGGSITLTAQRTPSRLAIAVVDTGSGIPYAQQELIFQPFVQVGSKRGGAGLGLAICKEIVRQHGGEIRVVSLPESGTTFTILLPI